MLRISDLHFQNQFKNRHFLVFVSLFFVGYIQAQKVIIPENAYGVWDRSNAYDISVDTEYNYLKGISADVQWKDVQATNAQNYDWTQIQAILETAYKNNQMVYMSIGVGPESPDWLYNNGVPKVLTDDTSKTKFPYYPYYIDQDYQLYFNKLIVAFGVFLRSQPKYLFEHIAYVQVKTGCTGDEVAYKGNVLDAQYDLPKAGEAWRNFRLATFEQFRLAFNTGDESTKIGLLFNTVDPIENTTEWNWILSNVTYGFGIKGSAYPRGHHLTGELEFKNTWSPYLINPKGIQLFSSAEMDQTWQKALYQINIPLGFYWGALNGLNTGLSIWGVTQSALAEAQKTPELHTIFSMFNKYAGQIYPTVSNSAYVVFHEGLNAKNTTKFPESTFGKCNMSNQDRYIAICKAYETRGAKMDDVYAATQGQVYQRDSQTGYNDAGWDIEEGNYERWISQINPATTSIGLFRVRGEITKTSSMYDRFARSFEQATGKNAMYFKFDPALFSMSKPQKLTFKITWLDKTLNSTWALKYYNGLNLKTAITVTGLGDNQWKSVQVDIEDAVVDQKGVFESDFILENTDNKDDIFHGIEVDIIRQDPVLSINSQNEIRDNGLFPNPTKDSVTWEALDKADEVIIYNYIGVEVLRIRNFQLNTLNLNSLQKGVYFITIKKGNELIDTKKIIKE